MNLNEFENLLLLYGPNLDQWPDIDKQAANKQILADKEFAKMLEDNLAEHALIKQAFATEFNKGAISAMVQQNLQQRRKSWLEKAMDSYQGMFAIGSVGTIGGVGLGMFGPLLLDSGAMISIAMGGILP